MTWRRGIALLGLWMALSGCGSIMTQQETGGTETGNPDTGETRTVSGSVDSGTSSDTSKGLHLPLPSLSACAADTVYAISGRDVVASTTVDESSCAFSLTVATGEAYGLVFTKLFLLVGVMQFDNRATAFTAPVAVVSAGAADITLGAVSIASHLASATQRVAEQNDQDADGTDDYTDDDDDNDAVADDDESDCDLDGIADAFDGDTDDCTTTTDETAVDVAEVMPRHDHRRDGERRFAPRPLPIEARMRCVIDLDTVTAETFAVRTESGDALTCEYVLSLNDRAVVCRHEDIPLVADTVYAATIAGVRCVDGRTVATRSWSWRTRPDL